VTNYSGGGLAGAMRAGGNVGFVYRDQNVFYSGKYMNFYIGDVLTKNRFTMNVGVRFDKQTARNDASSVAANSSYPNLLPSLDYSGNTEDIIDWQDWSPRLGLSYALDDARKTVLRASYASYASQLSFGNVSFENPVAASYLAYGWNDTNGDRKVQGGEINFGDLQYYSNVNPANPGAVGTTSNKVDRDYEAKRDHEFIVGLDRELGANVAVGAAYTWRKANNWDYRPRLAGACPEDPTAESCGIITPAGYTQNAPVSANGFTGFTYSPNAALVSAGGGGRIRTNRDGYSTTFSGIEFTLAKRLANRWMGRVAFSWNDWSENCDPQCTHPGLGTSGAPGGNPTKEERSANIDGGQVAILSGGSGKASFYTSVKWQVYANALVQLGWGFDLSAAVFAKQGGPYPISVTAASGADGSLRALADEFVDSRRYPDLFNLDLRLAKNVKLGGSTLTLAAEVFNVLNSGVVLSRARFANSTAFTQTIAGAEPGLGRIEEILVPRIFRIGARVQF
jgi:hypothetical protein